MKIWLIWKPAEKYSTDECQFYLKKMQTYRIQMKTIACMCVVPVNTILLYAI